MAFIVRNYAPPETVITRSNLEPVAPTPPAPTAPGFTSPTPPKIGGWSVRIRPLGGTGVSLSTSSATGVQGPGPGGLSSGAPPSLSSAMGTLATLPPAARTIIKIAPFVAALYFFNKGENVLGGASLAAGVGVLLYV
jgi:hypothetical protein